MSSRRIRWAGYATDEGFCSRNCKEKWHVRGIDVGRVIILRWILDKQDVTMCTVLKCPRISYEGLL
jgi:hypothetical protein